MFLSPNLGLLSLLQLQCIFFEMFSFSFEVAVKIYLLYPIESFLLWVLIFILDYFTSINNNYWHRYPYKFKKKYKINLSLKLISNIFLLLLFSVTMATTYSVNVTKLEGVIFCFWVHNQVSLPVFHQTFNVVYGVDLYEPDFHFIFDDVTTNRIKKLFKNAPD